jgi:hypothetical protein
LLFTLFMILVELDFVLALGYSKIGNGNDVFSVIRPPIFAFVLWRFFLVRNTVGSIFQSPSGLLHPQILLDRMQMSQVFKVLWNCARSQMGWQSPSALSSSSAQMYFVRFQSQLSGALWRERVTSLSLAQAIKANTIFYIRLCGRWWSFANWTSTELQHGASIQPRRLLLC